MWNKIPHRIVIERVANGFVLGPEDMEPGRVRRPMMVAETAEKLAEIVGKWGDGAKTEHGDFDTFPSDKIGEG